MTRLLSGIFSINWEGVSFKRALGVTSGRFRVDTYKNYGRFLGSYYITTKPKILRLFPSVPQGLLNRLDDFQDAFNLEQASHVPGSIEPRVGLV